jgi:hypothetical protein
LPWNDVFEVILELELELVEHLQKLVELEIVHFIVKKLDIDLN